VKRSSRKARVHGILGAVEWRRIVEVLTSHSTVIAAVVGVLLIVAGAIKELVHALLLNIILHTGVVTRFANAVHDIVGADLTVTHCR
jgi:uncharacterized membrane protein